MEQLVWSFYRKNFLTGQVPSISTIFVVLTTKDDLI